MICFTEVLRFIVVVWNQTSSISKIRLQFLRLKGGRSWKMPLNITTQMKELWSTEGEELPVNAGSPGHGKDEQDAFPSLGSLPSGREDMKETLL